MGRQAELMNRNTPKNSKRYKFTLSNAAFGTLVLTHAPMGWAEDEFRFVRDMKMFGVFQKFAQTKMQFVKEGRDFVVNCYEGFGVNADVNIKVEETTSNRVTRTRFEGKLDFSQLRITRLYAEIDVKDGSFVDLVMSRADVKVNILDDKSIDGKTITPATLSDVVIPDIRINYYGVLGFPLLADHKQFGYHVVPLHVLNTNFLELKDTENYPGMLAGAFFTPALKDYDNMSVTVHVKGIGRFDWGISVRFSFVLVKQDLLLNREVLSTRSFETFENIDFTDVASFTLLKGEYLLFEVASTDNIELDYEEVTVSVINPITSIDTKTSKGVYYDEAFRAVIAKITGNNDAFESSIFNEVYNGMILSGRSFRNISGYNPCISISLNDLFNSLSILNIGIGFENGKVVVEPVRYFFNDTLILDVSSRLKSTLVEREVATELYANRLSFGFDSYNYDFSGGIYEYNTESEWSTPIKPVTTQFKIKSSFRADSSGIYQALLEEDEATAIESDEDVFLLDVVDVGGTITARTNQGFDVVTGALNEHAIFNLDYSPARSLIRWGAYLRSMLHQNLSGFIRFQKSDKNTLLETQKTGESLVKENADIQIKDLAVNYFMPEILTCEFPIQDEDISLLLANPYGCVKVAPGLYGWVLDYKLKNKSRKATVRLLRTNYAQGIPPNPVTAYVSITASDNPSVEGSLVTFTPIPTNGGDNPVYSWFVNGFMLGNSTGAFYYVPVSGDEIYCLMTSSIPEVASAQSNIITMSTVPATGTIYVFKTVTDHPEDETYFHVTLTGQGEDPTIVDGWVKTGDEGITFEDLPFDTYVLTEDSEDGYSLVSISGSVVLDADHLTGSIEVVNEVVSAITPIKYGALYNWYAASKEGGTGEGSIAPTGWHVPSKTEFENLFSYVQSLGGVGGYPWHFRLMNPSLNYWNDNTGLSNDYGFGIKASGNRGVSFDNLKESFTFATINDIYTNFYWATYWFNRLNLDVQNVLNKYEGSSIRLIKNTSDWVEGETVTDIEGNIYPTVKIDNQVWMAANLAVTKFNDGTPIPNVTDNSAWAALTTAGYCWYNNDINNR